jgi:hypothetical protein
MERIQIADPGLFDKMTLQEALSAVPSDAVQDTLIQSGGLAITDYSKTLAELGLGHGSLLTVISKKKKATKQQSPSFAAKKTESFDPFPDLAKDYETALVRARTRRSNSRGMSFSTMASIQDAMHTVEPQPEGKIKRVYMCATSAARFQSNCIVTSKKNSKPHIENRVGLLLGTVQRERVNSKPKARTSLSSVVPEDEYCQAVKVHAVWEPPQQKSSTKVYDSTALQNFHSKHANVLRVAGHLGLQPVGWVFTYDGSKDKDRTSDDALPMFSSDIQTGASLQIENMQAAVGNVENDGSRFVSLAMDASSGATEAFQLSDVSVQMVAEDMFVSPKGRYVKTRHPVIVDGKETEDLDSVLCLVNTAMLSHEGVFSGKTASVKKKTGSLSSKARKAILSAVDSGNDSKLLEALCDFNTLLALDDLFQSNSESEQLCACVRKWARGQKKTTSVGSKIKNRLKAILNQV